MKKIFLIIYTLVALIIGVFFSDRYQDIKNTIIEQISSGSNISLPNNGNTAEPDKNEPIIPIIKNETEYDKFTQSLANPFVRKFNPPIQPTFNGGLSYPEKSNILNEYLKKNNFYFRNTSKLSEGYLYIKLAKPIGDYDIFLYFHDAIVNGYPISGKIIKQNNLILGDKSNQEFLFKLDQISIYKFYDGKQYSFNWIENALNDTNRVHFIGGYTTASDGNYIQEIVITGK